MVISNDTQLKPDQEPRQSAWQPERLALFMILGLTLVRITALFATPLNLYPDEAQYWLWSRELAFGYFSKPPMIAWLIAFTTSLGGNEEAFVRLAAPVLNAGTAAVIFLAGRRLSDPRTGLLAAALYSFMPGIQLSSGVISTDAPLLFFAALALYCHVRQCSPAGSGEGAQPPVLASLGFGAFVGLALLSKYAAVFLLAGLVLHLLTDPAARRAWKPARLGLALLALIAVVSPNLIWNATHGFATVSHTAANANLGGQLFNPAEMGEFLLSQFGVFGPIPAGVLLAGAILMVRQRTAGSTERMLLCFVLPPLLIIALQALLSRANANWAAIAYVPACLLVAIWLARWKVRGWVIGIFVSQGLLTAVFLGCVLSNDVQEKLGLTNSFKRAKGWQPISEAIVDRTRAEQSLSGLTAIAVDDRFLFNSLAYYGRDYFEQPGSIPLTIWTSGPPGNQAQAQSPLTPDHGQRVLVASLEAQSPLLKGSFARTEGLEISRVRLDRKRVRRTEIYIGHGYRQATGPAGTKP